MTTQKPLERFKRYLQDYQPQLEKALMAIQILEKDEPNSEQFINALADLHVCATILESYSEGIVEAIDRFIDENYLDDDKNESQASQVIKSKI